jgi:hypothetical protein
VITVCSVLFVLGLPISPVMALGGHAACGRRGRTCTSSSPGPNSPMDVPTHRLDEPIHQQHKQHQHSNINTCPYDFHPPHHSDIIRIPYKYKSQNTILLTMHSPFIHHLLIIHSQCHSEHVAILAQVEVSNRLKLKLNVVRR